MSIQKSGRAHQNIMGFAYSVLLRGFDYAVHRADRDAVRRVVVAFAFNAGGLIDHIQNAVAFADRFGRAFRDACTAGDAFFFNGHCHKIFSNLMRFSI